MESVGSYFPTQPGFRSLLGRFHVKAHDIVMFLAIAVILGATVYLILHGSPAYAGTITLPGEDASDKLEAAGTVLKVIDTGLFRWGARIFAGVCLLSAGWAFKEQRFGVAIVCILGAVIIGTAPMWVKNIFDIGGNQSLFSKVERPHAQVLIAADYRNTAVHRSLRPGRW